MNPRDLKAEIEKYKENQELQRISTTYSDEMYPWTAGKAPWSVEQGGTGHVPTGARNDVNITALKNGRRGAYFGPHVDSKEGIVKKNVITSFQSLDPSNLEGTINTVNELQHCYTLIQGLLKKAQTFHVHEAMSNDTEDIKLIASEVDASLEVLKNTPIKETDNQNHQRSPTTDTPPPPQRPFIKRERSISQEHSSHRNPSPPRAFQSPSRSYRRSPSDPDNCFSRSPTSNSRSSRDYDDYARNSDSGRESRSSRYERNRRHSNDRYRERDDYERNHGRDRSSRR